MWSLTTTMYQDSPHYNCLHFCGSIIWLGTPKWADVSDTYADPGARCKSRGQTSLGPSSNGWDTTGLCGWRETPLFMRSLWEALQVHSKKEFLILCLPCFVHYVTRKVRRNMASAVLLSSTHGKPGHPLIWCVCKILLVHVTQRWT